MMLFARCRCSTTATCVRRWSDHQTRSHVQISRVFCSQFDASGEYEGGKRQLARFKQPMAIKKESNRKLSSMGHSLFNGSLFTGSERKESTEELYAKWSKAYDGDMHALKFDSLVTMPTKIEEYLLKQSDTEDDDDDDDDDDEETDNGILGGLRIEQCNAVVDTSSNTKILDVGCGTGLLGQLLLDKPSECATDSDSELIIDGMDLTQEMLDILERERGDFYDSVQQHDITATPWPFANDSYDLTVCNGVLVYVKNNIDACLDEFVRVTKPGGYCLLMLRQDCLHTFSPKIYQLLTEKKWQIAEITDTRFNFIKQVNDKQRGYVPYNHHIFQVL